MKFNATPEEIQSILEALARLNVRLFEHASSYSKFNAQRNLSGRTHYYDDDTLRFHRSRVLNSYSIASGLLHVGVCSDALDWENTRRGFRVVVHDVFGTCVTRADLDDAKRTKAQAVREFEQSEFDLVGHYREAIQREFNQAAERAAQAETALELVMGKAAR